MGIANFITENYQTVIGIISAIMGGFVTWTFNKFKKRNEEVNTTGTEHDTVKRISQSSIETIEKLNLSFQDLSEKLINQRTEYIKTFGDLSTQLEKVNLLNIELNSKLEAAYNIINELKIQVDSYKADIKSILEELNQFKKI